ncbi:hypothetical protein [Marinimicrobium agarilyticum]|uniref:hypothetical protein n=1 Tax=Marinimicrobium agarilyticum TaxID=306546 RepID=UPI00042032C0|nr:hypothetical protein [Marinimicrobium agarilyticum]
MGRTCREVHEWIEEEVERPIEEWEDRQEERCREEPCNWWLLCLNKLVCWLVWVTVKVVRWVVVTVGKWVVRTVCTVVNFLLDLLGAIWGLILSIPILGGIIRTVVNWLLEIFWRAVGIFDFILSLAGVRPRKKMYFSIIVPSNGRTPLMSEAALQPWIETAIEVFDRTSNIDLRFTGICNTSVSPPGGEIILDCGAGGFFSDWWVLGSWFEFVANLCKFESNWRRRSGYGGEIIVFVIHGYSSNSLGCSMGFTHDYVTVQQAPGPFNDTVAHEIAHACGLLHRTTDGGNNLMDSGPRTTSQPDLTNWQSSVVRSSRHCTYL